MRLFLLLLLVAAQRPLPSGALPFYSERMLNLDTPPMTVCDAVISTIPPKTTVAVPIGDGLTGCAPQPEWALVVLYNSKRVELTRLDLRDAAERKQKVQ